MEALQAEDIDATCGIDVSQCLTGNVGTHDTLMFNELYGDAVTSAMALCGLAKTLNAKVTLTEAVAKDCAESCIMRLVGYRGSKRWDALALPKRGITDTPLFQALQLRTSENQNPDLADEWMYVMEEEQKMIDGHKFFENGVHLYFEAKNDEAYAVFQKVLEKDPTDLVAKKFLSYRDNCDPAETSGQET